MSKTRVVCFDLNGTLLAVNPQETAKESLFSGIGFDASTVGAAMRSTLMTRRSYIGASDSSAVSYETSYRLLMQQLRLLAKKKSDFDAMWQDSMPKFLELWREENQSLQVLPGAEQALSALKLEPGNKLVLVSNVSSVGKEAAEIYGRSLFRFFDRQYLSCDQAAAKPDPHVWQWVERVFPAHDEYWMVGDDPVLDIAVPRAMGWQTILVGKLGVGIEEAPGIISLCAP